MSVDARTIAVCDARAGDYDDCFRQDRPDRRLQAFIDALPRGARDLDLGCGPARLAVSTATIRSRRCTAS